MKLRKVLLITAAIMMVAGAYAQRANRGDVCQDIPDLTPEQTQKIDKFSVTHQETMDKLRTKFYSENDAAKASEIKAQMNAEMENHYQNIAGLLTPEQKTWYDQNCNVNRRSFYRRGGFGRNGRGFGRGPGYGRGQGFGRGQGYGRGRNTG